MNFILISPAFPENFKPFAYELANKGINVLGIGDTPYHELGRQLQDTLTEYYFVTSLTDVPEVKKGVAYLYYKYGKIDRIESHNEFWLELDAELREEFNVPGIKPTEVKKTKFKSEMKKVFKKAGIPVAEGLVVHTKSEIDAAVNHLGLPVIAKPDNGVGSAATFKIESHDDVLKFKDFYDESTPYFFEQIIQSNRLGTYDGLIDQHGNIVWETTLIYSQPTLEVIENQADMAFIIQKALDPKLVEYGHRIVKEFGMKERFFHIEFFKMADGEYIALEYNNRIAGNFAIDLYNFAHSINLFKEYANIVADEGFAGNEHTPKQFCIGITQRDIYDYVYNKDQIIKKFGSKIKQTERMPTAFAELMGNDFFAINADTQEEVDNIIEYIHARK